MRDTYSKDYDRTSKHDDPPNSRLFIAHTKRVSEEELREAFEKYGTVEDVWICKDKSTGDPKDISFVKFSKTSDAARAMEALNGKTLEGHTRPLRVTVALSRDQGNIGGKGDDMERLLRLFVVVPKSMTEEEVTEEFKQYGDLDYVSVVKDRETRESKGYAFVKYLKVSHAAVAFEECDRSFKAVFARPKDQDQQRKSNMSMEMYDRPSQSGYSSGPQNTGYSSGPQNTGYSSGPQNTPAPFMDIPPFSRNFGGGLDHSMNSSFASGGRPESTRITAVVSAQLTEEQVERLFDLMPGFVYFRFVNESNYGRNPLLRRVMVEYNNPSAANYAIDKLHGFEYPLGKKIIVKPEYDQRNEGMLSGKRDAMGLNAAPEITQELATLTKALAEATNMIKLQVGGALAAGGRMNNPQTSETYNRSLCSARLPPPQPLARRDSKVVERLFILGQPSLPSPSVLWDVFGRFGELVEVYIISGKNCGFVNYASKEPADKALEALNGEEVCQMRLKVTYADPPKSDRKRIKMDSEG